jgi:hypothetical protein
MFFNKDRKKGGYMKKKVFILSIVLMALFLIPGCRCNWEPVTEVTGITGVTAPPVPGDPDTLTFLYYADTRGDPFRPSSWKKGVKRGSGILSILFP